MTRTRKGSTRRWRDRRAWWADRLPYPCVRCGRNVEPGQAWHLDHTTPWADGGRDQDARPAHAQCNLEAGRTAVLALEGTAGVNVHATTQRPAWAAPGGLVAVNAEDRTSVGGRGPVLAPGTPQDTPRHRRFSPLQAGFA